ncbi:hypothetical protein niasHT_034565 [Heterodera trifolii]|uniref:non-specific serine/threonine protein kinase n=1 Tax=Heterodera trifolii TaxID=157864 RepID=A0ABD2ILH4_9BILA
MARTKKGRVSRFRGITKRNPGIEHHGKSIIEIDCCDATQIQKLKQCLNRDENDNLSNQFIMSNDETPVKIDEANKKPFKRAPHNKKKEVKKIDFDVVNSDEGHQPKANKRKRGKKEEPKVHPELEVYLEAEKNRLETILVDAADYELKYEDVPREKRQYLEPANQTSTCTTIAEMSSRDLFWEDSPLVGHQSQVKKSRRKPPPTVIQQQKEQSPPSPLQQSPTVPTAASSVASPQQRQSVLTVASSVASPPPPPPLFQSKPSLPDNSLPSTSTESKTSSVDPTMPSKPSIAHQSQVMNSRGKPPQTPPTVIHQQKEQTPPVSTAASSVASPQQIQSVLTTASLVASLPPPPPLFLSKPSLPDNSLPSTSTELKTSSVDPTNNKRSDLLQQIQQGTKLKKVGPPSTERTPVPTNAPTLRDNMMEQIKQGTTPKHVDQSDVENSRCSAGGNVQEIGVLTGALAIALEEQSRHAMYSIENSALASPTPSTSMSSTTFSTSALSPLKLQFKSLDKALSTNSWESELDAFLELCGQSAVFSWNEFEDSTCSFDKWSKIGEGAFGEVFKGLLENAFIALKVIPFAVNEEQCSKLVNGDYLKPAKFIFNELFITNELTKLSEDTGSGFVTPSFTQLRMSKIVRGCFPCKLLKAWDAFKKAKPELSENERPDIYADEGLHFVVIGLSYGGKDLEAYTIKNGRECYSIFHQIALSLAIAEDVLEFEHRDLHAGNILVEQCPANEKIRYMYRGEQIDVVSNGVRASIIDFSISRLKKKGVLFFVDLSQDTGLFEQNGVSDGGDYQYDVYRMMKAAVSENWASFWPQTNVYWMGYAAKKLFNNRFIRAKRKEAIEKLFSNFENNFETIHDFIVHPNFLSVFTEFTSE